MHAYGMPIPPLNPTPQKKNFTLNYDLLFSSPEAEDAEQRAHR